MSLTKWTAIVLLSIGVLKMIIGIFSPKSLLDYRYNSLGKFMDSRRARLSVILAMGLFMTYVVLNSGVSLEQWFVAGYSMVVIFVGFMFMSNTVVKEIIDKFKKVPESKFRLFCLVMLVLEVYALYIIWY